MSFKDTLRKLCRRKKEKHALDDPTPRISSRRKAKGRVEGGSTRVDEIGESNTYLLDSVRKYRLRVSFKHTLQALPKEKKKKKRCRTIQHPVSLDQTRRKAKGGENGEEGSATSMYSPLGKTWESRLMYRQLRHLDGYKLRGGGGGRENEEGEEKGTWPARGTRRRNTPLVSRFHLDENGRSVERSTYVQQPFQASLSRYGYNAASDQPRKNVATRNHRRTGQKDIRETSIPLLEFPFVCILPRQPIFPRVRREN